MKTNIIPQIIVLCLMFGTIILNAAKHGEERDGYNVWWAIFGITIQFFILKWGGFFDVLGW